MAEIDNLRERVKAQQDELVNLRNIAVELMDVLENYELEKELLAEIERLHQKLDQAGVLSDAAANILLVEGEEKYPVVAYARKVFELDEYKFPAQLFTKREPHDFGKAIFDQRRYRKLKQQDVADRAGISRTRLSMLENGGVPKLTTATALCNVLGIGFYMTGLPPND